MLRPPVLVIILISSVFFSCTNSRNSNESKDSTLSNVQVKDSSLHSNDIINKERTDTMTFPEAMYARMLAADTGSYLIVERQSNGMKIKLAYKDSIPMMLESPALDDGGDEVGLVKFYFWNDGSMCYLIQTELYITFKVLNGLSLYHFTKRGNQLNWTETKFPNQEALEWKIKEFKEEMKASANCFLNLNFPARIWRL
ncbi:hypothetical protein LX64_01430 [Chitinophaga skermanii]|uniref:Lipoprotein n=1 Tax=Chitinophaga skermanii TaxID=331697 RepID=A0A327QVT6_9BACT|nr:hypothetical protein [Chitinophaga skermanii]RAJ08776.1 hypothetical protein LX64_01430 [Chitinophaga skermanii]